MNKIFIHISLIGLLSGCSSPVIHVSVVDGITRQPLADVHVEYNGLTLYSLDVFRHAPADQTRILLGYTDNDGRITLDYYPSRGLTQLWFIKDGYAPSLIEWNNDEKDKAYIISQCVNDPEDVTGIGEGGTVKITAPLIVPLSPYKVGIMPARTHLHNGEPKGIRDPQ